MNRSRPETRLLQRRRIAGWLVGGPAMAALALGGAPAPVAATTDTVEAFGPGTWPRLQAELPRPAIVVFATTWCPHCPDVFVFLARTIRERGLRAPLVAVLMDGEPSRAAGDATYLRLADRLFVFQGDEAALRHSVDPRWRGVTPYVALLRPAAPPLFVAGRPPAAAIEAWAGGRR